MQRFEAVEPHMGTLVRITLYAASSQQAKQGFTSAFARIAQLDSILSDYQPESELSRLRDGPPVKVSEDLYRVLAEAQQFAAASGGAFDITAGPLIRLWRKARKDRQLPAEEAIQTALSNSGYENLKLDQVRHTVQMLRPGMRLDAGGIGKGYAADEALTVLRHLGLPHALVAMSGDLVMGAPPPGQKGWRVQVEPTEGESDALLLSNCAVSTSGAREQYLEIGGQRYSHIIDPRTGQALTQRIGVAVIARHGIVADALATAISVTGKDSKDRLAKRYVARVIIAEYAPH